MSIKLFGVGRYKQMFLKGTAYSMLQCFMLTLLVSDVSQAPCCAVFSKSCPFVSLAFLTTQKFNIGRSVNHFCLDVAWVTQQVSLDQARGGGWGGLIFTTSLGNTGLQTARWEKGWFSLQKSPFSFFLCATHSAPAFQSFIYISFHLISKHSFVRSCVLFWAKPTSFKECPVQYIEMGSEKWVLCSPAFSPETASAAINGYIHNYQFVLIMYCS